MSDYERNKGKLTPVYMDTEHFTEDDWDYIQEEGFVVIEGEVYQVEWEIERATDSDMEFADVTGNDDGSIDFHTYHYNGGAYWTEVVEDALKKRGK